MVDIYAETKTKKRIMSMRVSGSRTGDMEMADVSITIRISMWVNGLRAKGMGKEPILQGMESDMRANGNLI